MSRTCLMNSSSDPGPAKAPEDQAGALEISDVTVRFGGLTALDAVSLTAEPRKVTGIIGPNGAGKTTLLNVLCGFVQPDSGRLRFDGADLTRLRPHRLASLGIARTLQGVGLFPGLTVLENVMVGGGRRGPVRPGRGRAAGQGNGGAGPGGRARHRRPPARPAFLCAPQAGR